MKTCIHCKTPVFPKSDGLCPNCGNVFDEAPQTTEHATIETPKEINEIKRSNKKHKVTSGMLLGTILGVLILLLVFRPGIFMSKILFASVPIVAIIGIGVSLYETWKSRLKGEEKYQAIGGLILCILCSIVFTWAFLIPAMEWPGHSAEIAKQEYLRLKREKEKRDKLANELEQKTNSNAHSLDK